MQALQERDKSQSGLRRGETVVDSGIDNNDSPVPAHRNGLWPPRAGPAHQLAEPSLGVFELPGGR